MTIQRFRDNLRESSNRLKPESLTLSHALDILLIPIVGLAAWIKINETHSLYWFIAAVVAVYSIRALLAERARLPAIRPGPLDCALILLVVIEAVSYAASTYRPNSLDWLVEITFLFLFYLLIRTNLRHDYQMVAILVILSLMDFWLSARAVYSFRNHYLRLEAHGFYRLDEFKHLFFMVGPSGYATGERITLFFLLMPFPLALFLRFRSLNRLKYLFVAPVITTLVILAVSFSRGVYLAEAAFFVIAGALLARHRVLPFRRIVVSTGVLVAVLSVLLLPVARPVLSTIRVFGTESQTRSAESRIRVWKDSLRLVEQHPWSGVGSNNFPMRYVYYTQDHSAFVVSAFNYFLQVLVEKGIPGLVVYCIVALAFFTVAAGKLRSATDEFQKGLMILLISAYSAVLVRELTYASMFVNKGANTLLWLAFAIVAAATKDKRPMNSGRV
jgi:O-antigen ligase